MVNQIETYVARVETKIALLESNHETMPVQVYRYILNFLASQPTPEQVAAFRPTSEVQVRLRCLISRERGGELSADECQELNEYAYIEHLMVRLKSGVGAS